MAIVGRRLHGDAEVKVLAARIGPVHFWQGFPPVNVATKENYLLVRVQIRNVSARRKFHYDCWTPRFAGMGTPQMPQDQAGRKYKAVYVVGLGKIEGQTDERDLAAGESCEDLLVFDEPAADIQDLRLELPANKVGGTGRFRFRIPRTMVSRP